MSIVGFPTNRLLLPLNLPPRPQTTELSGKNTSDVVEILTVIFTLLRKVSPNRDVSADRFIDKCAPHMRSEVAGSRQCDLL